MSLFPNASVLVVLTFSTDEKEQLLMAYLKPVPDIAPQTPYWYPRRGGKGKASILWSAFRLKQYLMIADDGCSAQYFDTLIKNGELFVDGHNIKIEVPTNFDVARREFDPFSDRTVGYRETYSSKGRVLPPKLNLPLNLEVLEGYKDTIASRAIKPLKPAGLLEKGFLATYLKNDAFAVKESRGVYITFRGVRGKNSEDPACYGVSGFFQQITINRKTTVRFIDEKGNRQGAGTVGEHGLFSFETHTSCDRGALSFSIESNRPFRKIPFTLLKGFSFNVDEGKETYSDLFGRHFSIDSGREQKEDRLRPGTVFSEAYPSEENLAIVLSDYMYECFCYLGSKITIYDPYFLGPMNANQQTGDIKFDYSQKAFFNAAIRALVENRTQTFEVVGNFGKSKTLVLDEASNGQDKNDHLMQTYRSLLGNINFSINKTRITLNTRVQISRCQKVFHNRYWMGSSEVTAGDRIERCIVVSNSIGNMNEVDFIPVDNEQQSRTILARLKDLSLHVENRISNEE